MDGSALPFLDLVRNAGIADQEAVQPHLRILRAVEIVEDARAAGFYPADALDVTCRISFDHPLIGEQRGSYRHDERDFARGIGPARTFGMKRDVEALLEHGMARGGSPDNAVVLTEDGGAQRGRAALPRRIRPPQDPRLPRGPGAARLPGARSLRRHPQRTRTARAADAPVPRRRSAWQLLTDREIEPLPTPPASPPSWPRRSRTNPPERRSRRGRSPRRRRRRCRPPARRVPADPHPPPGAAVVLEGSTLAAPCGTGRRAASPRALLSTAKAPTWTANAPRSGGVEARWRGRALPGRRLRRCRGARRAGAREGRGRQDGLDGHGDDARLGRTERPRRGQGEVDDAARDERPAVVHPHPDAPAGLPVGDDDRRPERQRLVRRGHRVHVVALAVGRSPPVKVGTVPGGQPLLAPVRRLAPPPGAGAAGDQSSRRGERGQESEQRAGAGHLHFPHAALL